MQRTAPKLDPRDEELREELQQMIHRTTATVYMLLLTLSLACPAGASHLTQKQGRSLAGMGIAIQGVSLAMALVDFSHGAPILHVRFPYEMTTPVFAPLTIAGFEAGFTDNTEAGRLRALGIGFLEGALFSGIMMTVSILNVFTSRAYHAKLREIYDIYEEGYGELPIWAHVFAYANVAAVLLIPGIDLSMRARESSQEPGSAKANDHPPSVSIGPGGLMFWGRF